MPHRTRVVVAIPALAMLIAMTAGAVAAGNFAEVGFTEGMEEPPPAGEEREIGFSLLQHGVTPVNHGRVEVTATLPGTDPLTFEATSLGDGSWFATVMLPTPGDWQLRVTHSVFATPEAVHFPVAEAGSEWRVSAISIGSAGLLAAALIGVAVVLARHVTSAPRPAEPALR